MDSLNYFYNKGTNQLNHVTDGVAWANYPNDLNNEPLNNYLYNGIGELAKDSLSQPNRRVVFQFISWDYHKK